MGAQSSCECLLMPIPSFKSMPITGMTLPPCVLMRLSIHSNIPVMHASYIVVFMLVRGGKYAVITKKSPTFPRNRAAPRRPANCGGGHHVALQFFANLAPAHMETPALLLLCLVFRHPH